MEPYRLQRQRVRERRERLRLSQEQLGEAIGQDQAYVSRLESGEIHRITLPILARLADALHVSMDYLAGRSNDPGSIKPAATALVCAWHRDGRRPGEHEAHPGWQGVYSSTRSWAICQRAHRRLRGDRSQAQGCEVGMRTYPPEGLQQEDGQSHTRGHKPLEKVQQSAQVFERRVRKGIHEGVASGTRFDWVSGEGMIGGGRGICRLLHATSITQ